MLSVIYHNTALFAIFSKLLRFFINHAYNITVEENVFTYFWDWNIITTFSSFPFLLLPAPPHMLLFHSSNSWPLFITCYYMHICMCIYYQKCNLLSLFMRDSYKVELLKSLNKVLSSRRITLDYGIWGLIRLILTKFWVFRENVET